MLSTIEFTLNGKKVGVTADPMKRLLDVLRGDFGLTGTKEGCGEGECGACSVLKAGFTRKALAAARTDFCSLGV